MSPWRRGTDWWITAGVIVGVLVVVAMFVGIGAVIINASREGSQNGVLLHRLTVSGNRHHAEVSLQNRAIQTLLAENVALLKLHSVTFTQIEADLNAVCGAVHASCPAVPTSP